METAGLEMLFQAGVVGVFIFFALRMDANYRTDRAARDEDWRSFLKTQQESFNSALNQIDNHWREFLGSERSQRASIMAASGKAMEDLVAQVNRLAELITAHETHVDERAETLKDSVDNLARKINRAGK